MFLIGQFAISVDLLWWTASITSRRLLRDDVIEIREIDSAFRLIITPVEAEPWVAQRFDDSCNGRSP